MRRTGRQTHELLAEIAAGGIDHPGAGSNAVDDAQAPHALGAREASMVRLAALIAMDAPPASYARETREAIGAGVLPDEIVAILVAVADQVGTSRTVAAAAEIMVALGLALPPRGPEARQ